MRSELVRKGGLWLGRILWGTRLSGLGSRRPSGGRANPDDHPHSGSNNCLRGTLFASPHRIPACPTTATASTGSSEEAGKRYVRPCGGPQQPQESRW